MILSELLKKANIETSTDADIEITGLSCDSRKVKKGFAFVALSGTKENGERYIPNAIENGAVAILAQKSISGLPVPVFVIPDMRHSMALLSTAFYNKKPETLLAVTGTNGKTSTVFFVREILSAFAKKAASIGTLGVQSPEYNAYAGMTTTDSITLNNDLVNLANTGVEYAALEASSHGLDQDRLTGLTFKASAFTNLTRDHLDYHGTMEAYLAAKMRLFLELTEQTAVLNADIPEFEQIKQACQAKGLKVISYGKKAEELRLIKQELFATSQKLTVEFFSKQYELNIPVAGSFQGMNILAAIGLVYACGFDIESIIDVLDRLKSPSGRMELVGVKNNGASVFVDYAHTPDGLENALCSLKKQTKGKLVVVFGCGGNRDAGKRPIMGKIAANLADYVVVTDDNPRYENATEIRQQIMQGCPNATVIENRAKAIYHAIHKLEKDDILLIAGKGHEEGQMINGFNHPFNDKIQAALSLRAQQEKPLWTSEELIKATGGKAYKTFIAYGVSIDSRTVQAGDIFIAVKGEHSDGHDYVKQALDKGAVAAIVSHDIEEVIETGKLFFVVNTDEALEDMARYAVANSETLRIGITGSSGKTTSKEMLVKALETQGIVHSTQGNLNNQWGVPLTLARMPRLANFAVIEMGMNHTGEMAYLSSLVKPDIVLITMVGSAHHEFFPSIEDITKAKAEIFQYMNKQGAVFLNKDNNQYDLLVSLAKQNGIEHIYSFGQDTNATVRLDKYKINETGSVADLTINGIKHELVLQMSGLHFIQNALGVLGIVSACGKDIDEAIKNLQKITPLKGRGKHLSLIVDTKKITYIDDSYNANPSSVKASLNVLGLCQGRKIAVLGDMRELGEKSKELHLSLLQSIEENHIDLVIAVGSEMKVLYDALPENKKAGFVKQAPQAVCILRSLLQNGDTVLVKGSNGMKMWDILTELTK